jgi:hypothetical protein
MFFVSIWAWTRFVQHATDRDTPGKTHFNAAVLQTDDAPHGHAAQATNLSSLAEEHFYGVQIFKEGGS